MTELKAPDGKVVASDEQQGTKYDEKIFNQHFVVDKHALWSPDSQALYSAVSKVYEGNTLKDEYTTPFGIRSIEIIPNKGFYLNGERTTLCDIRIVPFRTNFCLSFPPRHCHKLIAACAMCVNMPTISACKVKRS